MGYEPQERGIVSKGRTWKQRKEERKERKQEEFKKRREEEEEKKKKKTGWGWQGGGRWTGYTPCQHYRHPCKVGEWEVLASGYFSRPEGDVDPPGAGVYLDEDWLSPHGGMSVSPGTQWKRIAKWYPAIYAIWRDGSTFPISNVELMIEFVVEHLEAGRSVEIGCQGGHGRTGTFIACLIASVEGLGAYDSIEAVRERHCKDCVETNAQVDLVYNFCNEEPPEHKPAYIYGIRQGVNTPLVGGKQGHLGTGVIGGDDPYDRSDELLEEEKAEEAAFGGSEGDIDYSKMIGYQDECAECGEDYSQCSKKCEFASAFAIDGRIYCSYLGRYVMPYQKGGNDGEHPVPRGYH